MVLSIRCSSSGKWHRTLFSEKSKGTNRRLAISKTFPFKVTFLPLYTHHPTALWQTFRSLFPRPSKIVQKSRLTSNFLSRSLSQKRLTSPNQETEHAPPFTPQASRASPRARSPSSTSTASTGSSARSSARRAWAGPCQRPRPPCTASGTPTTTTPPA